MILLIKPIKTLLCSLLCLTAVLSAGCFNKKPSVSAQETTAVSTQPSSTKANQNISTADTATQPTTYNYMRIKEKSESIMSGFDKYLISHKYNGAVYYKIGNDFEYIGSNGFAVVEEHKSNSVNTAYYAGSITKQFTAAAVLMLNQESKLSVLDTIDKYYPDYKQGNDITIYNLLTMTSGITSYMSGDGSIDNNIPSEDMLGFKVSRDNSASKNKSNIINWILKQELIFEPNTQFKISDSNYYLLGDIIEKVSGVSYEKYVTDNIIKPLGMGNTSFKSNKYLASGYDGSDTNEWIRYPGVAYSSSGLITNISDLLKWISAIDEYEILSESSVDLMFTPYKENYACGLYSNGTKVYQMSNNGQFSGMMSFTMDESEIFVSFSNYMYSDPVHLYSMFKKELKPYYK